MWTKAQQQAFAERGYFIASDAVSPDMVGELRQAARRVKARIRAGELDLYTDYRGEGEPYHVSGLIAPQYGEPIFAQYLASEPLLAYVRAQIGSELRFGSLSMFTNPQNQEFNAPWHRDDGLVFDKDEATELAFLWRTHPDQNDCSMHPRYRAYPPCPMPAQRVVHIQSRYQ